MKILLKETLLLEIGRLSDSTIPRLFTTKWLQAIRRPLNYGCVTDKDSLDRKFLYRRSDVRGTEDGKIPEGKQSSILEGWENITAVANK